MSHILLHAFAYCLVTFPYAVVWHMLLFKKQYEQWDYMGSTPKPQLGLLSMVIQGLALAVGFSFLPQYHASFWGTMIYAGLCGAFLWSSHVVAAMAKHAQSRTWGFFFMETFYLFVQFLLFGLCTYALYA